MMRRLHECSDLNEIAVEVEETNHALSPAVGHQPVHVLGFRVQTFQFFYKSLQVGLLKIEFTGIAFPDD
mgnify:CR=1 FL=1